MSQLGRRKMRQTHQRCRKWGYGNCHLRSSESSSTAVCGRNVPECSANVKQKQFISSHHEKVATERQMSQPGHRPESR